jgi:hypothetical protein
LIDSASGLLKGVARVEALSRLAKWVKALALEDLPGYEEKGECPQSTP